MKRRRSDDDARTHPHARVLEPPGEVGADAIFRSFVQRSSAVPEVPADTGTSPDATPADALRLEDESLPLGDATDPRIPQRWAETVEMLLEQGRSELHRDDDRPAPAEDVMLLTARKTAPPDTRAPEPDDLDEDARTVAVHASRTLEQLRRAGPAVAQAPEARGTRERTSEPPRSKLPPAEGPESEPWESVVRAPSETTQRREAAKLVPDVAQVAVAPAPLSERSEDGLIPSGLLDRKLQDMAVLLRYGHERQVRRELDQLRSRYPQDLLLARRVAEFYLSNERPALALEQLFALATGLFERRNVEGMRQALEQVLVIDPNNERAARLLGLLEQRPSEPPQRKPR